MALTLSIEDRMTVVLWIGGGLLALWIVAALAGVGKNTVFENPQSMTDAQVERTIRLTQRIMENSDIGSKAFTESGAKFSAALAEQRRRQGLPPMPPAGQ